MRIFFQMGYAVLGCWLGFSAAVGSILMISITAALLVATATYHLVWEFSQAGPGDSARMVGRFVFSALHGLLLLGSLLTLLASGSNAAAWLGLALAVGIGVYGKYDEGGIDAATNSVLGLVMSALVIFGVIAAMAFSSGASTNPCSVPSWLRSSGMKCP